MDNNTVNVDPLADPGMKVLDGLAGVYNVGYDEGYAKGYDKGLDSAFLLAEMTMGEMDEMLVLPDDFEMLKARIEALEEIAGLKFTG